MERGAYLDLMEKALDTEFLQTRFVKGLDLGFSGSWSKTRRELSELCALHGARLRIVSRMPEKDVSGLYDDVLSLITLHGKTQEGVNRVGDLDILMVLTHELAHSIQYSILRAIPRKVYKAHFGQFQNEVRLERAAEDTAFFLAINYFPSLCQKYQLKKHWFDAYTTKEEILLIAKRFGFSSRSKEVLEALSLFVVKN